MTCIVVLAWIAVLRVSYAEERINDATASHVEAVVALLDMTGVFDTARASTKGVVDRLQFENPKIPAAVWESYAERVADRETLISVYVPIYAKHLTEQDVRAIVEFYRTSLGTRLLQVTPNIQEESRAAVQAWTRTNIVSLVQSVDHQRAVSIPVTPASQENISPLRVNHIHELLRVSGTLLEAQQLSFGLLDRLRHGPNGNVFPTAFWGQARERLSNEADLLQLWTPAYAHQLTDDEILGLITFYRLPTGAHFVASLPAIHAECIDAGEMLAVNTAKRAIREVLGPLPQWRMAHPRASSKPVTKQDQ